MPRIIYDSDKDIFLLETLKPVPASQIRLNASFLVPIDKDIFMYSTNTEQHIIVRIPRIEMRSARFLVKPDGTIRYRTDGISDGVADLYFEPYADSEIFLAIDLTLNRGHLALVHTDGRVFHPAVPNVHGDTGALCLGEARVPASGTIYTTGVVPFVKAWLDGWTASPFNTDLWRDYLTRTLVFDADGVNVKLADWHTLVSPMTRWPAAAAIQKLREVANAAS